MCPDATASDDSGGELVAAAGTFILGLIIVPNDHETSRYAWLSTAAWVTTTAVCKGTCVWGRVDHCRQSWVDSPVVNCRVAAPYHVQYSVTTSRAVGLLNSNKRISKILVVNLKFNLVTCLLHYAKHTLLWCQASMMRLKDVTVTSLCYIYGWPQLTGQLFFLGTFNYSKITGSL